MPDGENGEGDQPLFVRWVADPGLVEQKYFDDGVWWVWVSMVGALFFALILGWIFQMSSRRTAVTGINLPSK